MASSSRSTAATTTTSCAMKPPINKLIAEKKPTYPSKTYPESVKEISAMLIEAAQQDFQSGSESDSSTIEETVCCSLRASCYNSYSQQEDEDGRTQPRRDSLKKSHTCGSLFAKCGCNQTNNYYEYYTNLSAKTPPLVERSSQKRASNPLLFAFNRDNNNQFTKRLSSPEIIVKNLNALHNHHHPHVCLNPKRDKTTIKANVYLNHPEVTFPIPIQLPDCDNSVPKISVSSKEPIKPTLIFKSQKKDKEEEAEKFLKEFGIISPSNPKMGNGVATVLRKSSVDNEVIHQIRRNSKNLVDSFHHSNSGSKFGLDECEHLKSIVAKLKRELQEADIKYCTLERQLFESRKELAGKDAEVLKLKREIHKLKSVLQQTTQFNKEGDILTSLQEQHAMANRAPQHQQSLNSSSILKKQGVSGESSEISGHASDINIMKYDKDFRAKQQIKDAIMDNDFLKHLDTSQVREIVDCMYSKEFPAGSYVIREGEAGAHLFVSAFGDFEVIKEGNVLGHMGPGKAFGELAILYNCTRTASIRVVSDSKVWVLDRKVFQQIMIRTGLQRLQDNINFLKSVPLLQNLNNDVLAKIADVLEVEFYPAGAYIIRQGTSGDTFFIISSGSVKVTQRLPGHLEEEEIRTLQRGDYFGEQALLKEDCRTASIIAMHPGVECLTLDRDSFKQLIGDLCEIKEKDYGDEQRLARPTSGVYAELQEYEHIKLDDLEVVATLGIGGFGRVELVQYAKDPSLTFALKCLKKQHIVDTQQQDHVYSERNIMISCRSPFVCRLYKTFRDSKYVYMLLEACLGGEVWTILRDRGCFDDHTTRFITACVVEAFEYLHHRGIIYRDLKPENLLLDSQGYVKLVDFGFSKRLGYSSKTWTFCGTPEYVAPETILNKGHDRAVDYWALGILMHELLTGNPPFTASDPMKTYNLILKGIDMIDFTKHNVGRSAQSLIKKLCRDSPSERLGYQRGGIQDIKKHKWFQGFDWDGLIERTLPAPLQQPIRGPCDTSNFDCFGKDNDIPPDELSGWDQNF